MRTLGSAALLLGLTAGMVDATQGASNSDTIANSSLTRKFYVRPHITTQPASTTATVGSRITLSVTAIGAGTLSYQWYKNGSAISGAASASQVIDGATELDSGSYTVTVSNKYGSTTSSAAVVSVSSTTTACDTDYIDKVLAAVSSFESAIGSSLTASMQYDTSSYSTSQLNVYKTDWSNLPPGAINFARPGITLSQLNGSTQINAFNTLVQTALSSAGYDDFQGVLAADDYLGYTKNASGYGASLYHIAVVGTPSQSGQWSLMLGGHHMAFNVNFDGGCAYPTPHHIGVEPRTEFTANNYYTKAYGTAVYGSGNYTVLDNKASAMFAVFSGMGSSALSSAFLTGQTYNDLLIGPVEANTGSYANVTAKFNTAAAQSNRGVLVSSLSSSAQALVTAAIEAWASDYDSATASRLLSDYQADYAGTYVAWANAGGTYNSSGPDVTKNGTYLRIDGPRVWIEIAVQNGIVISNQTHYHMIFRDKKYDYYNELGG